MRRWRYSRIPHTAYPLPDTPYLRHLPDDREQLLHKRFVRLVLVQQPHNLLHLGDGIHGAVKERSAEVADRHGLVGRVEQFFPACAG